MLVGSPSTASAHKLQSRVSIDLTGDEAAAAPVALPSATDDEHLLISRVQLEALVAADRWEAAEALGGRVYELAGRVAASPASAPHALRECVKVAAVRARLGILAGDDGEQKEQLASLLRHPQLTGASLEAAALALKAAVGSDFDAWRALALSGDGGAPPRLAVFGALVELLDAPTVPRLLEGDDGALQQAVQAALTSPNPAERGAALELAAAALTRAPAAPAAAALEPLLTTAVLVEAPPLRRLALSALCDFAWVLGRTEAAAAGAGAAAQLGALLGWLPGLLSAAHAVDLRTVAALGLGKLVLHRPDDKDYERSVLAAAGFEAEAVVAELAAVYTEVAAPTVAAQTAVGAPMMMGAIQTFYETLLKERPADVCNSIVFLCLEASDAGRLLPVADAATLRCLQWLASGLPPVDRGGTVDAVRQNLRDGCGVAATEAQVAGWLSR